ncbi:MAG: hypothetical protein K8H86_04545 [Ignavibacteriaceae bacterium]|nr:hypothetical protein [Ignavibacteriaceae bacterium]
MGTVEKYRGLGLGAVLLKKPILDLKTLGHPKAIITLVGQVEFKKNCNCKIKRVFWRYEKEME